MPPCHIRHVKLVAEADHPVAVLLPFLAPTLSQPWPFARPPSTTYRKLLSTLSASRRATSSRSEQQHPVHLTHPSAPQTRCYATGNRHSTRPPTSRRLRGSSNTSIATSKSRLAQEWYDNAFSGLDTQLVDQHEEEHRATKATRSQPPSLQPAGTDPKSPSGPRAGSGSRSRPRRSPNRSSTHGPAPAKRSSGKLSEEKYKAWQMANALRRDHRSKAWLKSRWTAHKQKQSSLRDKFVQVGHPVRLRNVSKPDAATSDSSQDPSPSEEHAGHTLGYSIPENTYRWNLLFARLQAPHDRRLNDRFGQTNTILPLDPKAEEFACLLLTHSSGAAFSIAKLQDRFGLPWLDIWLHAMLWLLSNSPTEALRFLSITHVSPYPPRAWVADSLQYLATYFNNPKNRTSPAIHRDLIDVFCTLLDRPTPSPMVLGGSTVRLLLRHCNKDQTVRIFHTLGRYGVKAHWNTLLHLSTYLAKYNCFDDALDALLEAASAGAHLDSPQYQSACSTILRGAASQTDGLRVSLRIIQNLSDLGVKLNIQHCNIVMLNAVESGDLNSAFTVHHSLLQHGLKADRYTYAILLKGCKSTTNDPETLNAIIRQAINDPGVMNDAFVATEMLHCLYMHHFSRTPETAFSSIAEAYTQLFDATSVMRIHILPPDTPVPTDSPRLRPTLAAVGIIMSAYLRDRSSRHSTASTHQIYSVYKLVRSLVERAVQPWASLAQTDYIANAFLVAFTSHPSSLARAAEVIRDMQTPLPALLDNPNPKAQVVREVCKPTVQSWSIFLSGFSKHNQIDLAEQVMAYMREKGMKPNQVTWNSMIQGYAGIGDHEGAVKAFNRMEDDGFNGNVTTHRAMAHVGVDASLLKQGEHVKRVLRKRIEDDFREEQSAESDDLILQAETVSLDKEAEQADVSTNFWPGEVEYEEEDRTQDVKQSVAATHV